MRYLIIFLMLAGVEFGYGGIYGNGTSASSVSDAIAGGHIAYADE